jgi:dTDP-4-dehydrorhamnose 3,5-epimerase-like enzyme
MKQIKNLATFGLTSKGFLTAFSTLDTQFSIKRLYYIYGVKAELERGYHAHKDLKQFAFCPYGDISIILDNGKERSINRLDKPNYGLIIDKGIWHEMIWNKENSVLCVAASDYYKENDYIRDYDEFLKLVREGYWDESE